MKYEITDEPLLERKTKKGGTFHIQNVYLHVPGQSHPERFEHLVWEGDQPLKKGMHDFPADSIYVTNDRKLAVRLKHG